MAAPLRSSSSHDEDLFEVKDLVSRILEKQGVLNHIRSLLRAAVFVAIDNQKEDVRLLHPNQKVLELSHTPGARLALEVIREFLEFFNLRQTLSVLLPEANMDVHGTDRDQLEEALGLHLKKKSPALIQLLCKDGTIPSEVNLQPTSSFNKTSIASSVLLQPIVQQPAPPPPKYEEKEEQEDNEIDRVFPPPLPSTSSSSSLSALPSLLKQDRGLGGSGGGGGSALPPLQSKKPDFGATGLFSAKDLKPSDEVHFEGQQEEEEEEEEEKDYQNSHRVEQGSGNRYGDIEDEDGVGKQGEEGSGFDFGDDEVEDGEKKPAAKLPSLSLPLPPSSIFPSSAMPAVDRKENDHHYHQGQNEEEEEGEVDYEEEAFESDEDDFDEVDALSSDEEEGGGNRAAPETTTSRQQGEDHHLRAAQNEQDNEDDDGSATSIEASVHDHSVDGSLVLEEESDVVEEIVPP